MDEHDSVENPYIKYGILVGFGMGIIFGIVFDNIPMGISLGVAIGIAWGAYIAQQAKHNDDGEQQ